ncbi:alpha/beta hydrolase family protein [Aquimarina algiphila]|uniref:alpha/beta hydrolase family protein n=1 Tax=Aquimarina algiphila TaxID=2047982 RepID=UPI00232B47C8|nr:alpha/beta fold hydrolase [Aquimarina algiphila]
MSTQELKISTKDGYKISIIVREPNNKRKGVVQIQGGIGLSQELYSNFATYVTQNGYTTVTFDYRGIGKSKPANLKGFKADIIDWGELDMAGVFDWVVKKYPSDKKIMIAHSIGGALVGLMENNVRIDQLFLIASSTAYWKDMSKPYRWVMPPVWSFFILIHSFIFGYVKMKKFKLGEDVPKGVALRWWKWSKNKNYFQDDLKKSKKLHRYDQIKIPLTSIQISDDPIANKITSNKLLKYYENAQIKICEITPKQLEVAKIGHVGFFSRKFKKTLWSDLLLEME